MQRTTIASQHPVSFRTGADAAELTWQGQSEAKRRETRDAPIRFLPMVAETQSPFRYNEQTPGADPAEHYAFVEGFLSKYDSLLRQGFYLAPFLGDEKEHACRSENGSPTR
jgi:hypothetical protein